ncbi:MAG: TetR/AcrR family transcriptional regulator [Candidatus Hydrogenedentes bacterium]|nr:TetR/AcrR family transcriptional regulator [Candidatus Hydrogenedentota bacterium]
MSGAATRNVPAQVKNADLVSRRRQELIQAAVGLFGRKGYHETTTRELAREVGWSVGALYEYISSKEDVLYLVCDSIHGEMERAVIDIMPEQPCSLASFREIFAAYLRTCDRMQAPILLIYQQTRSLKPASRQHVLRNEARITGLFEELIARGVAEGAFCIPEGTPPGLLAHNIMVTGHQWAFRRWAFGGPVPIETYIQQQWALLERIVTA